ncbi:hypothetical protein BRADI_3g59577v3 [Brachypodium distachyon]|uniref:BAH domain-containing protein n=1 Tax=Brachypodium distachyon TaxID=15368 RepID=A0A0Q3IP44_BRADI|nr:hypothetical protein BRADI_3g59577v3 [Brachypodium distachyon]
MHGRRADGGEGCGKRRPFLRHMWPATRVEAAPPPPAKGPSSPLPRSSAPPLRTTSYPPAPTTPPASTHKEEGADSPRPASADSFIKDGREFRVGDCALFQAVDVPPFIGLIRWIEKKEEGFPKLRVSWLYRSADVKLNKGLQVNAAPNEIFYSFHQDETSAVSLLHPCKVAFLRKGVELPAGISSFVCRRVYDIDNKCLWWLTDRDYINEEVNRLLHRTRLEMHAAVQSGGRSPKRLNGPSPQQKSGSDDAQSCGLSKGRKRDRTEQGIDPAKRDRERPLKVEDGELVNFKVDNMKSEITKFADKGGLPHAEAVDKLVKYMQLDQIERKIDLAGRVMLADIIAATESTDCLGRFVQLRGLPILNEWLQETHKGKSGEGGSPRETDKPVEEFLLALLRALAKLPINLIALQSCTIGKSVNHLRSYRNPEIQKKAKCLVDNWKKRVDAEMKSNEAKPVVPGQVSPVRRISWSGKGFPEISNGANRQCGSSEPSPKNSHHSSSKALAAKPGAADASSKLQHMQPASVATNVKDLPCKSTGGSELPTVKEEKSSSSSQSLNNSHSCSSDHAKTFGSSWKEDARSSTAVSGNASKTSGSTSRVHRRASSARLGSGIQKEAIVGRSTSLDRSSFQEKSPQSGMASEKGGDTPSDNGNSHRLIVRFPNPGRSPARSASGGSFEDPSVTGSRSSSPVLADKHEQNDRRVKMKTENPRPQLASDANAESWHSNEVKGAAGSEEADRSASAPLEEYRSRTTEEAAKDACAVQVASSSHANEKGVCSSETKGNSFSPMNALIEIKYSEAGPSLLTGDDTAMNLLASVAGEISKSELVSPSTSPRNSTANEIGCEGDSIEKLIVQSDVVLSEQQGPAHVEKVITEKQKRADASLISKEERQQRNNISLQNNKCSTGPSPQNNMDSKAVESSANTDNQEEEHLNKFVSQPGVVSQGEGGKACAVRAIVEDGCTSRPDVGVTLGGQCISVDSNRNSDLPPAEVLPSCAPDKQAHAQFKSTDEKRLVGVLDQSECTDTCGDSAAGKLDLKFSVCSVPVDPQKTEVLGVGNTVVKQDENKGQITASSADVNKVVVLPLDVPNGIKESKDSCSESSSHVKPQALISHHTGQSAKQSSKKPSDDVAGKEDRVSSDEGSSIAADKGKPNGTAKLDFDLNELGDEGIHSEPATSPVISSSAMHLPGLSPFVSPILSGLPAPITVAAPAKGPFVPPENLLRVKPEAGWKGSAATSAFRPAEPRKILGMHLSAPDITASDAARKHSRPAFDIDLNVADDQVLEEDISQSSAQTTGSESGNTRSRDGRVRSAGIELDLNRADEVVENSQFISMLPARPMPGPLSNADTNSSRNFFDLNNGPCLDEANTEPAQRSLSSKSTSSIPFLPQVAGIRMSNAEMGNMSPWFASANPCAPVALQSFLPTRGEHPYPIETAPGTQRIIAPASDGAQFRSDSCRVPVISTSQSMVFHPPAYQYAGFPYTPGVHLQTPGFPIGSTSYANSASAGVPYFPTLAPALVGSTGGLPAQHARPYTINLTEGSSSDGHDSNWKWRRQGLDLNSGPGSIDMERKDERVPSSIRQNLITPPQAFVEEQTRMYQMQGVGIKRKEPEGSWDAERSAYKQLSWQ